MKHICIFLAFNNFEHIKLSFESMYLDNIDFFVIENPSENSEKIKEFFLTKKLKGYIQFEKNIAANAVNIFIRDFYSLLEQYDIITITDGDLYLADARDCFKEIIDNLNYPNVIISSANLFKENYYNLKNPIIGIDNYIKKYKDSQIESKPTYANTANNLITLKKENLSILKNIYYLDSNISRKVNSLNKKWASTTKNIVYHLTWDLYSQNTEYYKWKLKVFPYIWKIVEESKYIKII